MQTSGGHHYKLVLKEAFPGVAVVGGQTEDLDVDADIPRYDGPKVGRRALDVKFALHKMILHSKDLQNELEIQSMGHGE